MLRPVLAVLSAAVTLIAPTASFDLRVSPKANEVYKYKMSGKITIASTDAAIGMNITETVKSKNEDGWTVEVAQTGGLVKFEAQEVPLDEVRQNITYGNDGLIRELKMPEDTNPDAYRLIQMGLIYRPDEKVAEGATYVYDFPADATRGVPTAKGTYTLIGEEEVLGQPTLKIEFKYAETSGDIPARNSGTYWLHRDKGVLVKAIQNWVNAPITGAGHVGGTFTTELIPDEPVNP